MYFLHLLCAKTTLRNLTSRKCGRWEGPGAVARLNALPLDMQAAPSWIPTSGTFFSGDLVMKKISMAILPLPLIQEEQLSVTGERM